MEPKSFSQAPTVVWMELSQEVAAGYLAQVPVKGKSIHTHTHTFTHYFFLIHPSVDWHLGYFQVLAIANNAAMNMEIQMSFWDKHLISFGKTPRSGIDGSHSRSIFDFLRNLHTVLIAAVSIYILKNNVRRFPFLHILVSIWYLLCFW